jgi:hypothetical protein
MAQSRRSRAHVFGRAAALFRLAPARAGGGLGPVLRSHHPGRRGIPFGHLCQPIRAAAAVEVSALACLLGGEAAPARPAVARAGPGGKAM